MKDRIEFPQDYKDEVNNHCFDVAYKALAEAFDDAEEKEVRKPVTAILELIAYIEGYHLDKAREFKAENNIDGYISIFEPFDISAMSLVATALELRCESESLRKRVNYATAKSWDYLVFAKAFAAYEAASFSKYITDEWDSTTDAYTAKAAISSVNA